MNEGNGRSPHVLLIDDEEMVLTSLKTFFEMETDWKVETFVSAGDALERLRNSGGEVDLILTDYLMPAMDGITFLKESKEIDPMAIRVLLTGYADKENAIRAINEVGLYQYVEKPWDNDALLLVVKNGIEKRGLIRELEEKIAALEAATNNLNKINKALIRAFV